MPPMLPICMSTMTQVGCFLGDEGHHLGARGDGTHLDVGPADHRLDLSAKRRRVAGDQDGLHRPDTIGPAGRSETDGRRGGRTVTPVLSRRGSRRPAGGPRARGRRSPKRGMRPTGAGATRAARRAKAASSRAATALSSARFALERRQWAVAAPGRSPGRRSRRRSRRSEGRSDPVDHQRRHGEGSLGQLLGEEGRFVDGVGSCRGDQHVGGGGISQQLADRAGPVAESVLHPLEGLEEGDGVLHDLGAGHLGDGAQQGLGGHAHRSESEPRRHEEGAEEPVLEEPGEARGRVEQVERVARRVGCRPRPRRTRPEPTSS